MGSEYASAARETVMQAVVPAPSENGPRNKNESFYVSGIISGFQHQSRWGKKRIPEKHPWI
jgi:hypothetical protein